MVTGKALPTKTSFHSLRQQAPAPILAVINTKAGVVTYSHSILMKKTPTEMQTAAAAHRPTSCLPPRLVQGCSFPPPWHSHAGRSQQTPQRHRRARHLWNEALPRLGSRLEGMARKGARGGKSALISRRQFSTHVLITRCTRRSAKLITKRGGLSPRACLNKRETLGF